MPLSNKRPGLTDTAHANYSKILRNRKKNIIQFSQFFSWLAKVCALHLVQFQAWQGLDVSIDGVEI